MQKIYTPIYAYVPPSCFPNLHPGFVRTAPLRLPLRRPRSSSLSTCLVILSESLQRRPLPPSTLTSTRVGWCCCDTSPALPFSRACLCSCCVAPCTNGCFSCAGSSRGSACSQVSVAASTAAR